jgi:hypothetical protein
MKNMLITVLFAIAVLNIIDAVWTTYTVKSKIAVELNPIANYLLKHDLLLPVKALLSILFIAFAVYIYFHDFKYINIGLTILVPILMLYLFTIVYFTFGIVKFLR